MRDEKIFLAIDEIGRMISDWRKVDSQEVGEQITEMIIDKAAELMKQIEPEKNCKCLCDKCECREECGECVERFLLKTVQSKKLAVILVRCNTAMSIITEQIVAKVNVRIAEKHLSNIKRSRSFAVGLVGCGSVRRKSKLWKIKFRKCEKIKNIASLCRLMS